MKGVAKTTLMVHLSRLEDPRTGQNTRHKFIEVLFIAVCAVISGCECWTEKITAKLKSNGSEVF